MAGDEGVGKSTVITNLRGKKQVASEHQGTGMEYAYLEAREEESEGTITSCTAARQALFPAPHHTLGSTCIHASINACRWFASPPKAFALDRAQSRAPAHCTASGSLLMTVSQLWVCSALGKTERVGIYTLDGDQDHSVLLQSVLNKETLSDIMVMIVVDLSRPWLVMDSLNKWSRVLADHIETLDADDLLEGLKAEQVKAYRTYTEDQEDTKKDGDGDAETIMLDLDDGVLTSNHGVPIVVVGTKVLFAVLSVAWANTLSSVAER